MATVTGERRLPFGLTLLLLAAVVVIGILAAQWVVGLVLALVRLILILVAFVLIARVALFLLRKGGPRPG